MKKTLHIAVADTRATYQKRDGNIVCGNKEKYQIAFTFDSEWDAYETKTARFTWRGQVQDVIFTGDTCDVPSIYGTDRVLVGVYAGDLITTTPAVIECELSILCQGGLPADPPDDVYAQIMELLCSGGPVPTNVDLSAYANGVISETYEDGSEITYNFDFDEDGNPVKITDSFGNVTKLTW